MFNVALAVGHFAFAITAKSQLFLAQNCAHGDMARCPHEYAPILVFRLLGKAAWRHVALNRSHCFAST
jgi:hypothetical protein